MITKHECKPRLGEKDFLVGFNVGDQKLADVYEDDSQVFGCYKILPKDSKRLARIRKGWCIKYSQFMRVYLNDTEASYFGLDAEASCWIGLNKWNAYLIAAIAVIITTVLGILLTSLLSIMISLQTNKAGPSGLPKSDGTLSAITAPLHQDKILVIKP